jgi:hypothetical protein
MYGYNTSENLANYPSWYSSCLDNISIYEILPIDDVNEVDLEIL